jgi:hypothetical protein
MRELAAAFNMKELVLSTSFRCPIKIVEEARWRAPHMQWPEWAKPGEVRALTQWNISLLPEQATILCRNNAPIFSMAIRLLRAGRYPEIVGNDIGRNLIKIMKKFGATSMPQSQVYEAIHFWREDKLKKSRKRASVDDQAACLRVFADQGKTLGEALAYAEGILEARGPITLMTVHKSKGLEFEHVILLDRHLIQTGSDAQEDNLLYVAQTRSKNVLWYANSEDWA